MTPIDRGPSIPAKRGPHGQDTPARHPAHAYIDPKTGYRDLTAESDVIVVRDSVVLYSDSAQGPIACIIELDAEGLEFLINELDSSHSADRIVQRLKYVRELAKVITWDKAAGR